MIIQTFLLRPLKQSLDSLLAPTMNVKTCHENPLAPGETFALLLNLIISHSHTHTDGHTSKHMLVEGGEQ